jgi:hypothetical protein
VKLPVEWDEDYVLNLPPGEHDWVEFKEATALDFTLPRGDMNKARDELSKQLSAFANSGGGAIVYGIADAPAGGGSRVVDAHGGVSLNLKNGTKEWLEDIIPNLVEFPLSRFNVYVIEGRDAPGSIAAGKGIVIIDVPSSEAAPHQASDKKYYACVGGKSLPIGHRIVMDIMGRAIHPKMEIICSFVPERTSKHLPTSKPKFELEIYCRNAGRVYANFVNGFVLIPEAMFLGGKGRKKILDGKNYIERYFENTHKDMVGTMKGYTGGQLGISYSEPLYATRFDPVLPSLGFRDVFSLRIRQEELKKLADEIIMWTIYADNAPAVKGQVRVGDLLDIETGSEE